MMNQPDKNQPPSQQGDEHPDQPSGETREPSTQILEPPRDNHEKEADPQRPPTDRREGVVSDPDVP